MCDDGRRRDRRGAPPHVRGRQSQKQAIRAVPISSAVVAVVIPSHISTPFPGREAVLSSLHCLFRIHSRSLVSSCTPGGEITTNAPGNVERGTNAAKLPDDETTPHRHTQSTDRQTQKEEREESARPSVYPPVQLKRARASERASEPEPRARGDWRVSVSGPHPRTCDDRRQS